MRALALAAALLLAACGSHALAPSPAALSASGVADGVTIRVDLDRASLRPGDVVWATVTIENTNALAINWVGGGCNSAGRVLARIPTLADFGRNWTEFGFAELKKRLALAAAPGYVPFLDEASWARRAQGGRACAADIRSSDLAAKGKLVSRFAWDGTLPGGGPAPSGDVAVIASLDLNDFATMTGKSVSATVTLPLTGGATTRVSPGQAVDAALDDTRFAAWVRARLVSRGNSGPGAYDVSGSTRLDGDTWVITATQKTAPAGEIEVRVSALDGSVRSVIER